MSLVPINTVAIPCLVFDKNKEPNYDFASYILGEIMNVECRNVETDAVGWWAIPQKDYGIFSGLQYLPQYDNQGNYIPQPSYDSQPCFRIQDKVTEITEYFIYGTIENFYAACATCCGSGGYIPMPGTDGTFILRIAPTVVLGNITNSSGQNLFYQGLPSLAAGQNYFPFGGYNNIPFPNASPTGYPNTTTLVAWLNANASAVGSPSVPTLVWSYVSDQAGGRIISTGGAVGDIIGMTVVAVAN